MRKIIFVLLVSVCLISYAQDFSPSAMGVRIGMPREMFVDFFSRDNFTEPSYSNDELCEFKDISFQGMTFDRVRFCFINDKLVGAIYDVTAKKDVNESYYIGGLLRICEMQYPMKHFENENYEWWSISEYKGAPILSIDKYEDTFTLRFGPFTE